MSAGDETQAPAASIRVTGSIRLDPSEISERFVRASGPGGQNVNKVSTAVELRFDVGRSPTLRDDVRARALQLAGRRATQDGVIVIQAQRFRTQDANRRDALERLIELLRAAAVPPKPRRATRPTLASQRRRVEGKIKRAATKSQRQGPLGDD